VRFDTGRLNDRWRDYYAGDDQQRAQEFVSALSEPGVDVVWFGRGGSGCGRILKPVLHAAAAFEPRIIVGFSDATAVLNAFATRLEWLTFHGPVVKSLKRTNLDDCTSILQGQSTHVLFGNAAAGHPEPLTGRLFGGNLMTLGSLVGTPFFPPSKETIWLLEEVGEYDYRVDRSLRHLRDAGAFAGSVGGLLGPVFQGQAQPERVQSEIGLPCVTGAPAGHHGPMALLPIGATVRVYADRLEATHPWVGTLHG
jgi:muramoyltetrapeptide carboxypeptidase